MACGLAGGYSGGDGKGLRNCGMSEEICFQKLEIIDQSPTIAGVNRE